MSYVAVPAMEVRVRGDDKSHYVTVTEIDTGGTTKKFFACQKADKRLERLLCPSAATNKSRLLARTSIFETIRKLRDDVVWARLRARKRKRCTNEDQAAILMLEDTVAEVAVPALNGMDIQYINVKLEKPGTKELQIEFSEANLEYLSSVVKRQLQDHNEDDIDRFDNRGVKGVTFSRGRNTIVAKKLVGGRTGSIKYKTFAVEKYTNRDEALDAAIEYMRGGDVVEEESDVDDEHAECADGDEAVDDDLRTSSQSSSVTDVISANVADCTA